MFKDNVIIIVAGASGDLAKKKTFPALFDLYCHGQLSNNTKIVGYARTKMDDAEYKKRLSSYFKLETDELQKKAEEFKKLCTYVSGQYDQDDGFQELDKHIKQVGDSKANRLFYLALPPSVFGQVAARVRKNSYGDNESRIIIEKPFGHDLESYRELQNEIGPQWSEDEVYRIDHYLGKEMVKGILPLRENGLFNKVWDKDSINNVEIALKEPFGTEGRGGYFDEIGIIRDVMQNHLLQVLSLVAMEPPSSATDPEKIRDEKVKLLESIKPIDMKKVVLGQYDKSNDGSDKPAYLDDDSVPEGSKCCTFAAFELNIDNQRWNGVPFVMFAGKALDEAKVEISVNFKTGEKLNIRVQPEESVTLKITTRSPGLGSGSTEADLELPVRKQFPNAKIPEAYEALILDALNGDHSNFVRDDELDVAWRIFTPLLQHIEKEGSASLELYPYGSKGPHGLKKLLKANL